MKFLWGLLAIVGLVQAVLLVLGVGIGFLLYWIIPGLGIGTAILVGAICAISSGHLLVLFVQIAPGLRLHAALDACNREDVDEDEDEDDDDDFEDVEVRAVPPRSRTRQGRRRRR
jgi:hypothetical protein